MAASEEKTAHNLLERKRTSDVLSSETINVDFASLMLSDPVQEGLTSAGFEKPSPIQLKAIPLGRCGLDLIVQAKSGTGKTCVFGVIALESVIATSNSLQILILAPTREIAVQIQAVIQAIGGAIEGLKCHTFIGGTIFGQDRQNLKKCHIAVGTPGRIKQLIEYDVMKTDSVRLFILDEADKLLDERFQASVNWIYHHLPENKQMLALSATYPETLAQQLTNYMRDPTFVRLNPKDLVLQGIKQFYKIVPGHHLPHKSFQIKADHLVDLLSQIAFNQCLIFSNLQSRAQNLCDLLLERGWPVTYISGNQEQVDRMKAMAELKTYKCRILISTDLTARGIDAENVNLIINLDVPTDFKTYLHRIGRAGRYGTHGAAITLASEGSEVGLLKTVQKRSGSDIKVLPDPLPSHLLELTFQEVETEVLGPESRVPNSASGDTVEEMTSSRTITANSDEANVEEYDGRKNVVAVIDEGGDRKVEDQRQESEKEDTRSGVDGGTGVFQNGKLSQNDISQVPLVDSEDDKKESEVLEDRNRKWSDHPSRGEAIWSMKNELEDWLVPMAIVQQAKATSRKRWTWQEAVKIFQDGGSDADEVVGRGVLESNSVAELENVGKSEFASHCQSKELLSEETDVKTTDSDAPSSAFENEEMTSEMTQMVKDGKSSGETLDLNEKRKKNNDDYDDVNESLNYLKDSDILEEFRSLKILAEQVKTGESVLEMQDLYPGFPRRDELDHGSSCHEKVSHDCNETSLRASSRNRNVEEKELGNVRSERLYLPKLHSGGEDEEKQNGSSHFDCGEDLNLNKNSTSSQRTGRPKESIQSTGGDVTEGAVFSDKGKVIAKKGMKINREGRQKARNARKSLSTERANLQGSHGNTNDDRKKPENIACNAQGCKTSDKIWENFKLFAKTYSQDVSREKLAVSPDEDERDSKQENKEEIDVKLDEDSESLSSSDDENETSVKNEMDKLHPDDVDFSEISSLSSEVTQESDPQSSMTDQYGVTDRHTETDFYYADLDHYPDFDTSYFGAEWSEKSSEKSKVKQIPEFGPTFVDAPVSHEACAYSDEEEDLYSYYWNESDRTAAEGWENYYGRSLQLWDGGQAYYGGEDLKLTKKSTSSQRTGRPNERIQPTTGDVTEGAVFSDKGKVIAKKGMKINREGRQKVRNATNTNVQDVNNDAKYDRGKTYVYNEHDKYQVSSDPGKSLSTERANLQGNHGNTNDDKKKPENIGCKTSDKVWEYFKLFAKTYSQDVSREKVAVSPDEGERDSKRENKEEIDVNLEEDSESLSSSDDENETSVKNEMDKLNPGDVDFSEISSLSSELTQESDRQSSMTDQYGVIDRHAETDFYYADLDHYPDCDTSYFGAEWSEKSSVKSKVKQIPEFGPTFVDAPVSHEACAYSDDEEDLYSYYWNESDRTAAEGWENYYGRSLQLWDGGQAYYDDGLNSPYCYEGCYPDMNLR